MLRRSFCLALAASAFFPGISLGAESPEAFVLRVSEDILNAIKGDARIKKGDKAAISALVDKKMMPVVDFLRMTRMAVGPKWREATNAEREEMQKLFRQILINVYSGALTMVTDHQPKILPHGQATDTDAVVRSVLSPSNGQDVRVDYRLKLDKEGAWKVTDVNVEGVWLVSNYRSQFGPVAQTSGIKGLIAQMKQRVEETKKDK
ncbi:MAG TPA: toluene tolerance protein [Sutterella sp.]|nr:toluene tolerance protein [Sutterella sp.]